MRHNTEAVAVPIRLVDTENEQYQNTTQNNNVQLAVSAPITPKETDKSDGNDAAGDKLDDGDEALLNEIQIRDPSMKQLNNFRTDEKKGKIASKAFQLEQSIFSNRTFGVNSERKQSKSSERSQ